MGEHKWKQRLGIGRPTANAIAQESLAAGEGAKEREPRYVTDIESGALVTLRVPQGREEEFLQRIFDGETICCDHCGERHPLWPPREMAQHTLEKHSDQLTVQGKMQMLELSKDASHAHLAWAQSHVLSRVSIRRRAHELDLWEPMAQPQRGGRIIEPN